MRRFLEESGVVGNDEIVLYMLEMRAFVCGRLKS